MSKGSKKEILLWIGFCASFILAFIVMIVMGIRGSKSSNYEIIISNILLFIFTTFGSAISGYLFNKSSSTEKIDTIAEISCEKMVNLSLELQNLRTYLLSTEDALEDELKDSDVIQAVYRQRILAAADRVNSLSSSNDTFRSDWLGVVSDNCKQNLEIKFNTVKEVVFETNDSRQPPNTNYDIHNEKNNLLKQQMLMQILPSSRMSVIRSVITNYTIDERSENYQKGTMEIRVLRETKIATGTCKLIPPFDDIPQTIANLISSPDEYSFEKTPYHIGNGTTYDFNINFTSKDKISLIPIGCYIFEYEVTPRES